MRDIKIKESNYFPKPQSIYYVRVNDFVLARVIKALKETEEVSDITVSPSDGAELLVAYDYKEN